MALIESFRATTVWKAFILNSILAAIVILIAMLIKERMDVLRDYKNRIITRTTSSTSILTTLVFTFLTSLFGYTLLHFIFDFGGGMLVSS